MISVFFRAISISEARNEYELLKLNNYNNSKNKTCVHMYRSTQCKRRLKRLKHDDVKLMGFFLITAIC